MSCIITYKEKQYSEQQFKKYFINNKNEFATSISKNKDIIDSFKRKIKAIDGVFKDSPELANIGTKAQYMQYLSTIFPDSKVKDIVYHGTNDKNFTPKENEQGIHFGFKSYVEEWMYRTNAPFNQKYYKIKEELENLDEGDISEEFELTREELEEELENLSNRKTYYFPAVLNIKNPKETTYKAYQWKNDIEKAKDEKKDGLVYDINEDVVNAKYLSGQNQVVFEPEQIHILGSKKDVERFQNFVNQNQFQQKQSNQKQPSDSKLNAKIKTLLEAIGVRVDYIENSRFKDTEALGVADMLAKVAYVSMNKSRIDTLPEEAAHFFVDYIEQIKDPLFNSMMYDIEKYDIFMETYQQYKNTYTKSDGSPDMYKIRKEAIGKMIAKIIVDRNNVNESQGLIDRFTRWLDKVLDKFKTQLAKIGLINEAAVENYFELAASNILKGKYQGEFNANNNYYNQQLLTESQRKNIANLKQSDSRWSKYSDEDIQRFIDSVFPNSKVKDIVYHGTKNKFDNFDITKYRFEKAIFFFKDYINALKWESNSFTITKRDLSNIFKLNEEINLDDNSIENNIFYALAGADNIEQLKELPNYELLIEDFNKIGGVDIYLNKNLNEIRLILNKYINKNQNNVISAILNLKNPKQASNLNYIKQSKEGEEIKKIFNDASKNNDGVILENITEYTSSLKDAEKNYKTKTVTFNGIFGIQTDDLYSVNTDTQYAVFEPSQIYILNSDKAISDMERFVNQNQIEDNVFNKYSYIKNIENKINYQKLTEEEKNQTVAEAAKKAGSVNALHDLAARLADRIGGTVKFENIRNVDYKGYNQGNVSVINEAYADTSTVVHEILGHPIIGAIRSVNDDTEQFFSGKVDDVKTLYKNLLKELEYGTGKEVFERVKRDYVYKKSSKIVKEIWDEEEGTYGFRVIQYGNIKSKIFKEISEAERYVQENFTNYTLEEQQEEALVELLGMYTANKLDAIKDKNLISLLKQLLKEMTAYLRSLFNSKEIEIEKLSADMTLDDLAILLAYRNSKIILPEAEVVYTTPDNQQFKTYQEASNHISQLAKNVEDVDLDKVSINPPTNIDEIPEFFNYEKITHEKEELFIGTDDFETPDFKTFQVKEVIEIKKIDNKWYASFNYDENYVMYVLENKIDDETITDFGILLTEDKVINLYRDKLIAKINPFIQKNKEYEQSKEIIEEWKKVNNIQYNPEEIYSRGQGFYHAVGAYQGLELELLLQNLVNNLEIVEKAGGTYDVSAFTKPVDKTIKHLEKSGVNFVIYPQPKDILHAANTDTYTGSMRDKNGNYAIDFFQVKGKKELYPIMFSKFPILENLSSISPNLASIVDNLSHHHNELGITLRGNNFRVEINKEILNETHGKEYYNIKKIVDSVNSILDQKYGKLTKPKIKIKVNQSKYYIRNNDGWTAEVLAEFDTQEEADEWFKKNEDDAIKRGVYPFLSIENIEGIQPKITKDNLKESIESVSSKIYLSNRTIERKINNINIVPNVFKVTDKANKEVIIEKQKDGKWIGGILGESKYYFSEDKVLDAYNKSIGNIKEKEYTEQALINTKIAKLKEVAKKYPRSLIRSEVKVRDNYTDKINYQQLSSSQTNKSILTDLNNTFEDNVSCFI